MLLAACVGVVIDGADRPADASSSTRISASAPDVESPISRSATREPLLEPVRVDVDDLVIGHRVVLRDGVAVRDDASDRARRAATLSKGDRVAITEETSDGWTEVVHHGHRRWLPTSDIARRLPTPAKPTKVELGSQPCASGSAVEAGLQPDTVKVHRAVCAEFPDLTTFGGTSGSGEHATGQALDIMITGARGDQVAAFLQEHRQELGIEYLIWRQRIWNPTTSPDWRPMEDRDSPTANHLDHVHVTTIGSAATS